MNQLFFTELNVDELLLKIGELIEKKLNQRNLPEADAKSFLSRLEVANLLKISLPTLNEWTKLGWLQSYKIGNRVLYKSNEIEDALQKVSSQKFKKYIK
jgi:excisionase family DNA binding protein